MFRKNHKRHVTSVLCVFWTPCERNTVLLNYTCLCPPFSGRYPLLIRSFSAQRAEKGEKWGLTGVG